MCMSDAGVRYDTYTYIWISWDVWSLRGLAAGEGDAEGHGTGKLLDPEERASTCKRIYSFPS